MEIRRYESFDDFRAAAEPVYRRDPVNCTVELTVLHGGFPPTDPLLLTVCSNGVAVGAALQIPPYPLLCNGLPESAIGIVVTEVARTRPQLVGVRGLRRLATRFTEDWQAATGRDGTVVMRERLYRLGSLRPPSDVKGTHRAATEADSELLDAWLSDFHLEVFGEAPHGLRRRAFGVLWTVDEMAKSLAMVGQPIGGVARIGPVYTPVDQRGHGYGSAVTAAAARWALNAGAVEVVLFTDLGNAVSNSIYQRIGFEPVTDSVRIDFAARS